MQRQSGSGAAGPLGFSQHVREGVRRSKIERRLSTERASKAAGRGNTVAATELDNEGTRSERYLTGPCPGTCACLEPDSWSLQVCLRSSPGGELK